MTTPAGQLLPVPEGFPVGWPDPHMETLHWSWDQMHHPHPKTPLSATFEGPAFCEGTSSGFQGLGVPLNYRVFVCNGYWYGATEFYEEAGSFPPSWWPKVEQEFMRLLPNLRQTWEKEYLPEVQAMNRRLRDFDYEAATLPELLDFIDETHRLRKRAWEIHMLLVPPVMGAASRLAEVYEQLLGEPGGQIPYLMLQGFENLTVESGKALWQLSRRALAEPALARLIDETPVDLLPEELQRSTEGTALWGEFQRYLDQYGWRGDAFELADPAWVEDPAIPLTALRELLHASDDSDPALQQQRSLEERERLVEETLERLDGHEGKPLFEML